MTDSTGQDQFQAVANRRAGYSDQLQWALRQARKGGTLQAGEGLLIVEHYEAKLAAIQPVIDAVISYCHPPEHDPWGYGEDERYQRLSDAVKDVVDARALVAAAEREVRS